MFNKLKKQKSFLQKMKFYFNFLTNTMYMCHVYIWIKFFNLNMNIYLNKFFLKSKYTVYINFIFFFFKQKKYINNNNYLKTYNICNSIISNSNNYDYNNKIELYFTGLGYKIKKISNGIIKFFLGYSNYIYLLIPNTIRVKYIFSKKKLILVSLDLNLINNIVSEFLLLIHISIYRKVGIFRLGKIIQIKIGKKR